MRHCLGTVYEHVNDHEHVNDRYILAQVDYGRAALICLQSGNRFRDPAEVEPLVDTSSAEALFSKFEAARAYISEDEFVNVTGYTDRDLFKPVKR